MKSPKKLLEMLLVNWAWCVNQPKICKAIWLPKRISGDEFYQAVIRALVLHGGDWRAAVEWMKPRHDRARLAGFVRWVEALLSPVKRGLLLSAPVGYQDAAGFHYGVAR